MNLLQDAVSSGLAQWPTLDQGYTGRALVGLSFKHKWVILLSFVVTSAAVWTGLLLLPPTYVAQGKVLLRLEQEGSPSFFSGIAAYREPRDTDSASRKLETEMGLIAARPLSEGVVRQLNLKYSQVYHAPYVSLLDPISDRWAQFFAWWEDRPPPDLTKKIDDTVREFSRSLEVKADATKAAESTPNIVEVSLKASDPDVARDALDLLIRTYIKQGPSMNSTSGEAALAIVRQHLDDAQRRVVATDDALRQQLSSTGMSLSDASPGMSADTAMPATDASSSGARDATNTTPSRISASADANVVKALKMQLTDAEMELAGARTLYTDKAENVTSLRARVADLRQRLQNESRKSADDQVRLKVILRELAVAETNYVELSRKHDQIQLFLQMQPAQALNRAVVEAPLRPRTSEWRKSAVIGIAGSIAGLFLGFALAAIREYFDHRLTGVAEAEDYLGVPVLGVVPESTLRHIRSVIAPVAQERARAA